MAALIDAIDIKRKMFFELDGTPFHCLDVEVNTPTARGGQTLVRIKMRNLLTRAVFDKTFKASDKFKEPDLEMVPASFLYSDADGYYFMDQESFETLTLRQEMIGDAQDFLGEGLVIQVHKFNGNPDWPATASACGVDDRPDGAGRARRFFRRQRDQTRHAGNRPGNPRASFY